MIAKSLWYIFVMIFVLPLLKRGAVKGLAGLV